MPVPEITVAELEQLLEQGRRPALLDVRQRWEHEKVALPGSLLIPLDQLPDRLDELEGLRDRPVVVYCHHGVRSLGGAALLNANGFQARSLEGGIERFAVEVDPTLPRY